MVVIRNNVKCSSTNVPTLKVVQWLFIIQLQLLQIFVVCNGSNDSNNNVNNNNHGVISNNNHQTIIWEQNLNNSLYSSVGIIGSPSSLNRLQDDDEIRFAAATWLNNPKMMEVFSTQSKNATADWSYQPPDIPPSSTLAVTTSRHIDYNSAGQVDVVVANEVEKHCFLLGFNSKNGNAKPIWRYNVPGNCSVDLTLEGDSKATVKFSDDGSTVVFAVLIFDPVTQQIRPQLHCIEGQTGVVKFVHELKNEQPGTNSVSLSRDGAHIAYSNGLTVYVLEKATGTLRTKPLVREIVSDVHICPMGIFLLYAINQGSVIRRWNESSKEFEITPYQPKTPPGDPNSWIAVSHSTSVNGEGKSSSGCLAAVGWLGLGQNQGVAKLEVFSMLTGEIFIEWSSKKGMGFENFPVMAMHLGYTALGTWGNSNPENGANNIFLFHTDFGNQTLMEYNSKGSIMAIDMMYTPYSLPPLPQVSNNSNLIASQRKTNTNHSSHNRKGEEEEAFVYLIAAGKFEHATVQGKGGQCIAFRVPVKFRPPPPL